MNLIRMPSPAILVVALALVAALAGTAVAGPDASTSAISKKKVKKLIKKEVAKQIANAVGPQGAPGEQGQPGQDATNLFAYIRDDGSADTASVQYGSGVIAVNDESPPPSNGYTVTFDRSLVGCVVQASPGVGNPAGSFSSSASFPLVSMSEADPARVRVRFISSGGSETDTAFFITAFC